MPNFSRFGALNEANDWDEDDDGIIESNNEDEDTSSEGADNVRDSVD